jgi:branched-subunit amino acid ABC-type transport system permease component
MEALRFSMIGLSSGALIALVALGIVLVYRSSGVLNFASGAIGAVGAEVTYNLRDQHHVHWLLAIAIGILAGAALGVATQMLVMTLLRGVSALGKLIATLGILSAIQGAALIEW